MRIKHDTFNYTYKFTLGLCSIPMIYDRTPKGYISIKFTITKILPDKNLPSQGKYSLPNCTIFWRSFATWSASSSKHFYRIIKAPLFLRKERYLNFLERFSFSFHHISFHKKHSQHAKGAKYRIQKPRAKLFQQL